MAPEEWPIAAPPEEQGASPARFAGRGRLSTVRADFFLDPEQRLTEQERALMTGMAADLLATIADEMQAALPDRWSDAHNGDGQQLMRKLVAAGLLHHWQLIGLLLRRADEERIGGAIRARTSTQSAFLQALVSDPDEQVAAAAMSLILARGRRRDRLNQPRIEFDDLPREVAADLANAIAAALRSAIAAERQGGELDRQLAAAIETVIARHDPAKKIEALTANLVQALVAAGQMEEGLIAAAAEEGDVGFLAEALAEQAGISGESAWAHMVEQAEGRFVELLRMADVSRDLAARLLATLGDLLGIDDLVAEITRFDEMQSEQAGAAREWLKLDPAYRAALSALRGEHG